MLLELHIRNFAIIDDLQLTFGGGLNVLTGETGAGKSIIIDALGLLLGDRATADWVRAGSERAEIEATFRIPLSSGLDTNGAVGDAASVPVIGELTGLSQLPRALEAEGLIDSDNPELIILTREVRLTGRNLCRINGHSVNVQMLGDVASLLIDVHGQGEHLNLLRPKTHVHLLDRYAGLVPLRRDVSALVSKLRKTRTELEKLNQDARTIAQRVDMLSFQLEEINEAALAPDEETSLANERRRLSNAESLMKLSSAAQHILTEGDSDGNPAALDMIGESISQLERLARIDPSMDHKLVEGQSLLEQFLDLSRDLQDYSEQLEFNPDRLAEVEERLELIATLKRKYGDDIEQVLAFGAAAQAELDTLGNWEAKTTELEEQEEKLLRSIGKIAVKLSKKRKAAGKVLSQQIETELAELRMDRARFGAAIEQSDDERGVYGAKESRLAFDATGIDQVEFMISANPGEPLKPMAKVASGGETARLMLALKSVLAHADATPTLIFDEIDQGIGGRVGAVVGQKLWNLTVATASNSSDRKEDTTAQHQVLCITHLPQLAAFGDQHYTVKKRVYTDNGTERTGTIVDQLAGEVRIEELMQMLGATTKAGRQSVEEMIDDVARTKSQIAK